MPIKKKRQDVLFNEVLSGKKKSRSVKCHNNISKMAKVAYVAADCPLSYLNEKTSCDDESKYH